MTTRIALPTLLATFSLVVAGLTPEDASAQFAPLAPANPGDRTTTINLTASGVYDSNVAGSDAQFAARRGIKPSDFIFEPGVQFDLARPIGRQEIYLTGSAGYDFYTRNSILNRENIVVEPGFLGQFGRCEANVSGFYSRGQSQLSEIGLSPVGPAIVSTRDVVDVERVTGGALCGRATGLAPTITVSQSWTHNSLPIERLTNSSTTSVNGGVAYRRPTIGSITLFGNYSHTEFPDRTAFFQNIGLPAPPGATYDSYSGGVSYTRPIGTRLQGSASLSYTDLSVSGGGSGFSGLTYSAALAYVVTPRLTTSINISRATLPSNRLNSSFDVAEIYSGEADYKLGHGSVLRGGGSYESDNYNQNTSPVIPAFDLTQEKIYRVYAGGERPISRRLGVALDVAYSHREANFPGLTYSDVRATLSLRATF